MPITHYVDKEKGILIVKRSGSIETHDEERALKERKKDPDIFEGIPVLVDCREVFPGDLSLRRVLPCQAWPGSRWSREPTRYQ